MKKRAGTITFLIATFALVGCSTPPDIKVDSLEVDVQPDFNTFMVNDLDQSGADGGVQVTYGDYFLWVGDLFKPGTSTKVGRWICRGVKHASLGFVDFEKPMDIKGSILKTWGTNTQSYLIDGKGDIELIGLEPGYDGKGGLAYAIVGGTGDYAGASGVAHKKMALAVVNASYGGKSVALDPPFKGPQNDPTYPAITNFSARITFDLRLPAP